MKSLYALILAVSVAHAETWTMTNGVPVTGTVVSSQVACVWIKSNIGPVYQIPIAAFDEQSCKRLPQDAAGIFVAYDSMDRAANKAMEVAKMATDKYMLLANSMATTAVDASIAMDSIDKRMPMFIAELNAWREANKMRDATPEQRQAFVDERVAKAAARVLSNK